MILKWWGKWLRRLTAAVLPASRRERKTATRRGLGPRLELLEDRAVPAAGVLDPTFGVGGQVTTTFPGNFAQVNAVVGLSDNSTVAVGEAYNSSTGYDFALAKYLPNGTLDPSFGSGGMVTTDFFGGADKAQAVALLPGGNIVVAGTAFNPASGNDFALAEYTANGVLDSSFGTGGIVTTDFFGGDDQAFALAVQPNGQVVVGGYAFNTNTNNNDFALARYNANGTLDSGFGTGGKVTTDFAGGDDEIQGLALQPDGMILAAGFAFTGSNDDFALARYSTSGTLDPTFGTGGKVTTDFFGSDDQAHAVALEPGGQIVVGGQTADPKTGENFALAEYDSSGNLDSSFGSGGLVTTSFNGVDDEIHALDIQPDGKIVATGFTNTGTNDEFALARYNTNGSLDTTFGAAATGMVTTNFSGNSGFAYGATIQANGDIVAAGVTDNGTGDQNFALARYFGDAAAPTVSAPTVTPTSVIQGVSTAFTITGTFADPAGNSAAPFTAVIHWGDNTTSTAPVSGTANLFSYTFNGTHTYTTNGSFDVTVSVTDASNNTGTSVSAAVTSTTPDANTLFEEQVWQAFLGRPLDAVGLAYGTNLLNLGFSQAAVISTVESSQEYQLDLIDGLITSYLGRPATQADQTYGLAVLAANGTVEQLKADLLGSPEFYAKAGSTNAGWLSVVYQDVLGRSVDTQGSTDWNQALNAGVSRTTVALAIVSSPEAQQDLVASYFKDLTNAAAPSSNSDIYVNLLQQGVTDQAVAAGLFTNTQISSTTYNAVTGSEVGSGVSSMTETGFLNQVWQDLLGRPIDAGGLAWGQKALTEGFSRSDVVLGIEASQEYQTRFINEQISAYFGRTANAADLTYGLKSLAGGTVEQYQASLLGSAEYFADAGSTNDGWLTAVYKNVLNRAVDPKGSTFGNQQLNNGVSRQTVALEILTSNEAQQDLIQSDCQTLLRGGANTLCVNYFLAFLQQGASDQEVLASIAGSLTYDMIGGSTFATVSPTVS